MIRLAYDTDLTNDQWEILNPLIPPAKPGGRPRTIEMREVLTAIFYLLANGIKRNDDLCCYGKFDDSTIKA